MQGFSAKKDVLAILDATEQNSAMSLERPDKKEIYFIDTIPLNQKFSKEEAVEKIASFHNVTAESVLDSFLNLRNFNDQKGFIIFNETVNNGFPCIGMQCFNEEGKWVSSSLINKSTGQPMEHVA